MFAHPANGLNDKYLRQYGLPLSVIAYMLSQMPIFFPGRWDLLWKYTVISLIYTILIWELSRYVIIQVRRRFPGLAASKQRVSWTLVIFTLEMAFGQLMLTALIHYLGLAESLPYSFFQIWVVNFGGGLFFIVLIGAAYEAVYSFHQFKTTLLKAEQLKKEQAQQRLETLKNRVNPHFLFNSLTTLSALIGEAPQRAEQFVDELSKVYRYLLRARRQPTASLGEELQFAASYAFLLKNRFETEAFSVTWVDNGEISEDLNIPVLSLQHTLDYFVRTQNAPLHIKIDKVDNQLRMSCAYVPKTLSFDVMDNDWKQLESNGAQQVVEDGQLIVRMPMHAMPEAAEQ